MESLEERRLLVERQLRTDRNVHLRSRSLMVLYSAQRATGGEVPCSADAGIVADLKTRCADSEEVGVEPGPEPAPGVPTAQTAQAPTPPGVRAESLAFELAPVQAAMGRKAIFLQPALFH